MPRSKMSVIEVTDANGCCPLVLAAPLEHAEAAELARGFTALADPVRLRLLSMWLWPRPAVTRVCDFIGPIGKTQGTISHHLRILGEVGLVHGDRRGKWVWYSSTGNASPTCGLPSTPEVPVDMGPPHFRVSRTEENSQQFAALERSQRFARRP